MNGVIDHLRKTAVWDGAATTDGQLLERFLARRDEAALAALVRRHAPMVWGVCRRFLHSHHEAEDAFQATFLVLVRRAASIQPRDMVANWLYGVARQTALNARTAEARRKSRERQVAQMPEPAVQGQELASDLGSLLDQELTRLPDRYRVAIVLCDLNGTTRYQAARQLGVPEGTLSGWLTRGRTMLAKRLARHGPTVSGGLLTAALAQPTASASAPASIVASTIKAATATATGNGAATAISAKAAALAEGVLKTMFFTKLKVVGVSLLLAVAVGFIGNWLSHRPLAAGEPNPTVAVQKESEQQPAAGRYESNALYELHVELRQPRPNPSATAVVKNRAAESDKSFKELGLRFVLVLGAPAKAQLGQVVTVGDVKREPLGLFVRARINEEKSKRVSLELALEDVGLVDGNADIKRLIHLNKAVPLGIQQEHSADPKANPSGLALKFMVKRLERLEADEAGNGADATGDRAALRGIWTGYVAELSGRPLPNNLRDQVKVQLLVKGGEMVLRGPMLGTVIAFGSPRDTNFTFQVDEARNPKSIDLTIPKAADDLQALTVLGLYNLRGEELKLCLNAVNKQRPAELKTQAQTSQMLVVLKRDRQAKWEPLPEVQLVPPPAP